MEVYHTYNHTSSHGLPTCLPDQPDELNYRRIDHLLTVDKATITWVQMYTIATPRASHDITG
jgi:HD superfamily phosphohydrolase YqeK